MIILLEGPDGSGKSTLASKLSEAFNYDLYHFSEPKTENVFGEYWDFLAEHDDAVVDRMWPSTQVYGPIMRNKSEISNTQAGLLEGRFGHKIVLIYCTDNPDILWQRCCDRGEDYVTDKITLTRICAMYDFVMNKVSIPVHRWSLSEQFGSGLNDLDL